MDESQQIATDISKLTLKLAALDIELAMEISSGIFVNLYSEYARRSDYDQNREINITGGDGQRAITIHALESRGE